MFEKDVVSVSEQLSSQEKRQIEASVEKALAQPMDYIGRGFGLAEANHHFAELHSPTLEAAEYFLRYIQSRLRQLAQTLPFDESIEKIFDEQEDLVQHELAHLKAYVRLIGSLDGYDITFGLIFISTDNEPDKYSFFVGIYPPSESNPVYESLSSLAPKQLSKEDINNAAELFIKHWQKFLTNPQHLLEFMMKYRAKSGRSFGSLLRKARAYHKYAHLN